MAPRGRHPGRVLPRARRSRRPHVRRLWPASNTEARGASRVHELHRALSERACGLRRQRTLPSGGGQTAHVALAAPLKVVVVVDDNHGSVGCRKVGNTT